MAKTKMSNSPGNPRGRGDSQEHPANAEQQVVEFVNNVVKPHWPILVGALVLVVAAVIATVRWQDARNERIATALEKAVSAETVGELQAIAEEYGNSPAGRMAAFLAARQLYDEAQYFEAVNAFAEFNEKYGGSDLETDARLGWAYALEADGRLAQARTIFTEIAQDPSVVPAKQAEAYCGAARTALAIGETEAARQSYEDVLTAVDDGLYREQARQMLRRLDIGAAPVTLEGSSEAPAGAPGTETSESE